MISWCLYFSDLVYLVWFWSLSMFLQMALFHSFFKAEWYSAVCIYMPIFSKLNSIYNLVTQLEEWDILGFLKSWLL